MISTLTNMRLLFLQAQSSKCLCWDIVEDVMSQITNATTDFYQDYIDIPNTKNADIKSQNKTIWTNSIHISTTFIINSSWETQRWEYNHMAMHNWKKILLNSQGRFKQSEKYNWNKSTEIQQNKWKFNGKERRTTSHIMCH